MCNHIKVRDLVTHWQCENCGRMAKKCTGEEQIADLAALKEQIEQMRQQFGDNKEIKEIAREIDVLDYRLQARKPCS